MLKIQHGTINDIPAITAIARQYPHELAFVRRVSLERAAQHRSLFVAMQDDRIVGFVSWNARRDGWSTVYDLAVDRTYRNAGIGRALLYAVPCPVRLKCTEDNDTANRFYERAGMRLTKTEPGKQRGLNVWEMRILNVIVRGNSKDVPEICRRSGSAYGVQERDTPYSWAFMVDVEWGERANWQAYLEKVKSLHPVQAMCIDYERPDKTTLQQQIDDLRQAGVLRVMVCPKFAGAMDDIPNDPDIVIAVSLRTDGKLTAGINKFSGWMPELSTLRGRRVHLLGGSPKLQKDTICKLQGVGARVLSVDGNAQFGAGVLGSVYSENAWRRKAGEPVNVFHTQLLSSINIQREVNAAAANAQLPLF